MNIFKIFRMPEWQDFERSGVFRGSPDDLRDGFIHFSSEDYLLGTLARYFKDEDEIIIARAENAAWGDKMKWEASRGGGLFPHLYTALYLKDITQSWHLQNPNGRTWDVTPVAAALNIQFAPPDV